MARARNIKPGFFRNSDLVELDFETRLLFIGLWTLADREGRLEDRPKQIKMELFPADNVDCDSMLNSLSLIGVIARYEVDGKRYIQVTNFLKHQNPHRDERCSTIPDQSGNVQIPKKINEDSPKTRCKHHENTVQASCKDDGNPVVIGLNPDSGFLNPDVLNPDSLNPESLITDSLNPEVDICTNVHRLASKTPYQQLIDLYHDKCNYLPRVTVVNDSRKRAMKARFSEVMKTEKWTEEQTIGWFGEYYGIVNQSKFLTGRAAASNGHRPFKADWDWIHNPNNFVKVVEGKYNGG